MHSNSTLENHQTLVCILSFKYTLHTFYTKTCLNLESSKGLDSCTNKEGKGEQEVVLR